MNLGIFKNLFYPKIKISAICDVVKNSACDVKNCGIKICDTKWWDTKQSDTKRTYSIRYSCIDIGGVW